MRAKELKPLFKELLKDMPGFVFHKSILLISPMNGLLRAIDFDSSAYDKFAFYPATFVMPLCVPIEHLALNFGHRLRHPTYGEGWTMKIPDLVNDLAEAIREQGLPFLAKADTFPHFADLAASFPFGNPHTPKAIAFALARAGKTKHAIATIDSYLPTLNLKVDWEQDIADLSIVLRDKLIADPDAAQAQLRVWEDYTIEKLGLGAFR